MRVKAPIQKEKNSDRYSCNSNRRKKKSNSSSSVIDHPKPWNGRFFKVDENEISSCRSDFIESNPTKEVNRNFERRVATYLNHHSGLSQTIRTVSDRQDGRLIMTKAINCRSISQTPSQNSRAVSPFNLQRVKGALDDVNDADIRKTHKVINKESVTTPGRRQCNEIKAENIMMAHEKIQTWQNSKTNWDIYSFYFEGLREDCSSLER